MPCGFGTVLREGTDRAQMEQMLAAAAAWTSEQGWPRWQVEALHPRPGSTAEAFWSELAARLRPGAAVIVGFGDPDGPHSPYEPHRTCVERIDGDTIYLRDSDEYEQVRRSATGIRPEPGWDIEDCFLVRAVESLAGQEAPFDSRIAA